MRRFLLPGVLLLAFFLRVWQIGVYPTGFTPDEASFGYDAYSILKTGKDQWGKSFPLVLKSFGDFKSPLYAYLTVPSVAVFGLNKFSVRLPNVLVGTLAVLTVYLLVKELTQKKNLAMIAALLLTVSPWQVMLSRGAFEANLITFFLPLGIYLFLKGKHNLASLVFGLGLFTYHSPKLIIPIIFLALIFVTRKVKLFSVFLFSIFLAAMFYSFQIGGGARVSERAISQGALEEGAKVKIELIQKGMNPITARLLHNKYQITIKRFINNYSQYFSYKFLFKNGPAEATYGMIPGIGVMYPFEGILLLGLVILALKGKLKKVIWLIIGWLFISPVPAALATGVGYSANRAAGMVIPLVILEVFGVSGWYLVLQKLNKRVLGITAFIFLFIIVAELTKVAKVYYQDSPKITARAMLSGNLEAAYWLKDNTKDKQVTVSTGLSEPQIYIAFANSWDPSDYQKQTKSWKFEEAGVNWVDQIPSYSLGHYVFQNIDWKVNTGKPDSLSVGRPEQFLPNEIPTKIFSYPDGSDVIFVVDSNKR